RLFRRLSLLDPAGFAGRSAAAALGASLPATTDLLDELADARLLEVLERDTGELLRFRLPGLVRLYAAERLAAEDPPADRDAARRRVLDARLLLRPSRHGKGLSMRT